MTGNVTFAPSAYLSVRPHVSVALPAGSTPLTLSFQASSRSRALIVSVGGAWSMNVPRTAMPVLPVLKPPACAPTTPRATPP